MSKLGFAVVLGLILFCTVMLAFIFITAVEHDLSRQSSQAMGVRG